MARIRSVHPSLWTDEAFLELSPHAKLFIIALWNECDDGGAFQWKPKQLKVRLFGCDDLDVPALLLELERANFVRRYDADGAPFGAVRSFGKFQKPQKPTRQYPMPPALRAYAKTVAVLTPDEKAIGTANTAAPDTDAPALGADGDDAPVDNGAVPDEYDAATVAVASGEEGRGEERIEEENTLPSVAPQARQAPTGSRLSPDWRPSPEERAFAVGLGLDADAVAEGFRDHWVAKAGKDARKADWTATWRNWCRTEAGRRQSAPARGGAPRRSNLDWMHDEFLSQGAPS
ncbi:hypothetical protein [Rhizosaccharibacter radicis]|uniref:DnaT DNA-binding domain-containing protein n=1 Tax=Rhizosaccharibacter radicis TaxID=2782605 RepID=A0ABT1VWI1_9PROT|nr:hypothetical protein [Acetobacteraceae bacterium KSS12]